MSKKDLFKNQNSSKFISSANFDKLKEDAESKDFILQKAKNQRLFHPKIDFSDPANFARYGLAEEYYRTTVEHIYKTFPYDGSLFEREKWYSEASYLDRYIYEHEYPRTNGFAIFGQSWGTAGSAIGDYNAPSDSSKHEFITLKGGPNPAFFVDGSTSDSLSDSYAKSGRNESGYLANVYKASKKRENNLKFDLSTGITVEFWLKKDGYNNSLTKREVLFDLWNNEASSSAGYGRLSIELSASSTSDEDTFRLTCQSGAFGFFDQGVGSLTTASVGDGNWTHYAVSFLSKSSGVGVDFYTDGKLKQENVFGTVGLNEVLGPMTANIGSLSTTPSGNLFHGETMTGYGKLHSSSIDEFRYWKTRRAPSAIFNNYNNQVGGGSNTDDANTDLGVYYKFNEGITRVSTTDNVVLDYSGRVSNGTWNGYTINSRNTGSAIVQSSASVSEYKDPIIYSYHPDVFSVKNRLMNSGSIHDESNNSALFYTYPSWLIEGDEEYGGHNLRSLSQIMASYLDTLYVQIEELNNLKNADYTSGSHKPNVFIERALSDKGVVSPKMFIDSSIIETLLNRNEATNFEKDLVDIKNKIYENVYNNISNIFKSKGTYDSFRNVLNSLGISRKIVDVKMYSSNNDHELLDDRKQLAERKKFANFFKADYYGATIHQHKESGIESRSFITGSESLHHTPVTIESVFTIPKDNIDSNYFFIDNNNLTCSLFGVHATGSASETDLSWPPESEDVTIQTYAVRDKATQKSGYFLLTGSIAGTPISPLKTANIDDLFDDTTWVLAARFKPQNWPLTSRVSGAYDASADMYQIELKGINLRADIVQSEFLLSGSLTKALGQSFAQASKRLYLGAHKTNFTGSVYDNGYSFAKFSNLNFWYNYVSDQDLKSHLLDHKNYGISKAHQSSVLLDDNYPDFKIPNADTLVLRWDFESVTGSDGAGNFIVDDVTSGSVDNSTSRYGFLSDITRKYQYLGRGDGFSASKSDVVRSQFVNSYKLSSFEEASSNNMVSIVTDSDEIFQMDKRPAEYYFSVEKNYYSSINERVIETLASLKDFNNLIGETANKYRPEYKELGKFRKLFFEKVQNDLDFEKFIEFYKWVDSSVSFILEQLVPLSAEFSPTLSNVVESHILERNKYTHRVPVVKPIHQTIGIINTKPSLVSSSVPTIISGTIENIISTVNGNYTTSSYRGAENNTVGITRIKPEVRKPSYLRGDYDVVMTADPNALRLFTDSSDFDSTRESAQSFHVSGTTDYSLPSRPVVKSNMIRRFSAPGGKESMTLHYLDYPTTQFSVYDTCNYRNSIARSLAKDNRVSASLSNMYSNPRKEIISGATSTVTGTLHDNAYVIRPIPASVLQNSWITQSYDPATTTILNIQSDADDIKFTKTTDYSNSQLYSASINTSSNLYSADLSSATPENYNTYISNIVSRHYGWNTWRQIAGNDSQVVKYYKKNNILAVSDDTEQLSFKVNDKRKVTKGLDANSTTNFIEPVFTKKYKPVKHMLVLDNEGGDVVETKSTFAAINAGFANKSIDAKIKSVKSGDTLSYDKIRSLYMGLDPEDSPLKGWLSVEYSEGVWPKERHHGLDTHRNKSRYESTSEELKSNLCQYRTLWNDSPEGRKRAPVVNYPFTLASNSLGVVTPFAENIFPLSDYSATSNDADVITATYTAETGSFSGSDFYLNLFYNDSEFVQFTSSATVTDGFNSFFSGSDVQHHVRYLANKVNTHPTASLHFYALQSSHDNLVFTARKLGPSPFNLKIVHSSSVESSGVKTILFAGETEQPSYTKDGELNSSFQSIDGTGYHGEAIFGRPGRTFSFTESEAVDSVSLSSSIYCEPFLGYHYPVATQTYIHMKRSGETDDGLVAPYTGHPWRVAQSSSRRPFFANYEEYAADIKPLSQDYSIVPEFNFSDSAIYYLDTSNENFRVENKKLFRVNGASSVSASAASETSSYSPEFHKNYVYSDFLQKFDSVRQDHRKVGEIGEITLTCKGVKKFRPEQGFYPASRAVQLGTLFSQSMDLSFSSSFSAPTLVKTFSSSVDGQVDMTFDDSNRVLQAAMQPLFAPGILYNTIKSGIAVDWPIVYSGSLTTVGNAGGGAYGAVASSSISISNDASERVPFEALTNLDLFPKEKDVLYLAPSWQSESTSCSQFPYFHWKGKRKNMYERASNNFLSEVSQFFLKNKNYTSFESEIENNFKAFEAGNTYYMDVYLQQTDRHFMWRDYFEGDTTLANGAVAGYSFGFDGRAFGPAFQSSTDAGSLFDFESWVQGNSSDPGYLPYVPPYFYGQSTARISFTPAESRKYKLDEILSSAQVEYKGSRRFDRDWGSEEIPLEDLFGLSSKAAYKNRMRLSSSMNLFEKITKPAFEVTTQNAGLQVADQALETFSGIDATISQPLAEPEGNLLGGMVSITSKKAEDSSQDAWRIAPKFECPILNFYNQPKEQYMSRGMWGGLGEFSGDSEGIYLAIKDSFNSGSAVTAGPTTGSLASQLGFKKVRKKLGEISEATVIKEAVIAIPFLERDKKSASEADLTTIDARNFFKIDSKIMNEQLTTGADTTITRMVQRLHNYVIPPNYNFIKYKDIDPFVMYVFEFDTTFNQQDLSYIWQGVMPDASLSAEHDEVTIRHNTGLEEFFHGKEVPSDIRWMLFKVKKRARKSYTDVVNMTSRQEMEYGYNWPYDYCSLVEVAKLDVSMKITPKKDVLDTELPIGKILKDE